MAPSQWHQSGNATPSEQHERPNCWSAHARANTHVYKDMARNVWGGSTRTTEIVALLYLVDQIPENQFSLNLRENKHAPHVVQHTALWIHNTKASKKTPRREVGRLMCCPHHWSLILSHLRVDPTSSERRKVLCASPPLWRVRIYSVKEPFFFLVKKQNRSRKLIVCHCLSVWMIPVQCFVKTRTSC